MTSIDVDAYLDRLDVPRPADTSPSALARIHRAHVARVPYENLLIQLGCPADLDPATTVARILRGGGGYCFELNGALGTLLAALGFEVSRHEGRCWPDDPDPTAPVNHLVLTVRCDDGSHWLVEAGMSDAVVAPLPLIEGEHRQGPFDYRLERVGPDGWRFRHDPAGSFSGMDFALADAEPGVFDRSHARLSRSDESPFVRALSVAWRDLNGADVLRGRVLWRWDASGRRCRTLDDAESWFRVLRERFGLPVDDLSDAEQAGLWRRVTAAHDLWQKVQSTGKPVRYRIGPGTDDD